jgi:hypothetical protein
VTPVPASEEVCSWVFSQLLRLGYSPDDAERAAEHVDWHEVSDLLDAKCPPETALRIAGCPPMKEAV